MGRGISLAVFTISTFSESKFWHIPPALTTIYSPMDSLGWRKASLLLRWNLRHALFFFFFFFVLCEQIQNPAESTTTHKYSSSRGRKHWLTLLSKCHYSFLRSRRKNESGLLQSTKLSSKPLPMGNAWDFVFGFVTTFGIYMFILAIVLLNIENIFIGKQDSVVWVFWNLLSNFAPFVTFFFFWVLRLINDSHSVCMHWGISFLVKYDWENA